MGDWINDLLECELMLLARRGEPLTLSESCDDLTGTSDYLEAVHSMDQEDIRCLMPKPRDLHDFCSTECVAMEIYSDSHLQGLDNDKTVLIPTQVAKSLKSTSSVTDPRQMRIMNAKIEELQQHQLQSKKAAADREKVERHL